MNKTLTIAYVTSRREPRIEWFADSLMKQVGEQQISIIIVDHYADQRNRDWLVGHGIRHITRHVAPKPTIWQGPHRLTKEDWWAKSNALNTAICLCETEWLAFVDDRSVLCPGWLDCIAEAMRGEYAVCGSYEKHLNLKVEAGVIVDQGITDSIDHRTQSDRPQPTKDWFGGHGALPLEWCLSVNGYNESYCDGLGLEDCMFGLTLYNAGFPICCDSRLKIIEDRTQGEIDGALKRSDFGQSPNDASHRIVELLSGSRTSQNPFDLREIRERVLLGEPFPPPSASHNHFFTGQPITELA